MRKGFAIPIAAALALSLGGIAWGEDYGSSSTQTQTQSGTTAAQGKPEAFTVSKVDSGKREITLHALSGSSKDLKMSFDDFDKLLGNGSSELQRQSGSDVTSGSQQSAKSGQKDELKTGTAANGKSVETERIDASRIREGQTVFVTMNDGRPDRVTVTSGGANDTLGPSSGGASGSPGTNNGGAGGANGQGGETGGRVPNGSNGGGGGSR